MATVTPTSHTEVLHSPGSLWRCLGHTTTVFLRGVVSLSALHEWVLSPGLSNLTQPRSLLDLPRVRPSETQDCSTHWKCRATETPISGPSPEIVSMQRQDRIVLALRSLTDPVIAQTRIVRPLVLPRPATFLISLRPASVGGPPLKTMFLKTVGSSNNADLLYLLMKLRQSVCEIAHWHASSFRYFSTTVTG